MKRTVVNWRGWTVAVVVVGALALTACVWRTRGGAAVYAEPAVSTTFVVGDVPPARVDVVSASPGFGYVWVGGHWLWEDGWYWHRGRWVMPPRRGARWTSGRWVAARRNGHDGHRWVAGRWR